MLPIRRLQQLSALANLDFSSYGAGCFSAAPFLFVVNMSKSTQATQALEEAFLRIVPTQKKKRLSEIEWISALRVFNDEAKGIRRRFSLGIFARARTAYLLQQHLIADGIPPDVVRKLVFSLVVNSFIGRE